MVKHGRRVARSPSRGSNRSRSTCTTTAARRSSSVASSASCVRSRRSSPAHRRCPTGASCRTTSSARVSGRRSSACSATSSRTTSQAVIHWAERGVLIFGWIVGTIVLIVYLVRRFRKPEERAKLSAVARRAGARPPAPRDRDPPGPPDAWDGSCFPIARFFGPQLKFAWERFTPGGLGLEFTTVMAVLIGRRLHALLLHDRGARLADNASPRGSTTPPSGSPTRSAPTGSNTLAESDHAPRRVPGRGALHADRCRLLRLPPARSRGARADLQPAARRRCWSSPIKDWTEVPRPPDPLVET